MLAGRVLPPGLAGLALLVVVLGACSRDDGSDGRSRTSLLDARPRAVTESRLLRFGDGERRHLGSGWHGDEWNPELRRHFVWAHGRRAVVRLTVLQVLEQQVLLELSPVAAERTGSIEVSVNGTRVATLRPVPGYREYRFVIPADVLRRGRNTLAFDHEVVGPPPRELAASYSWILLGPACLRLRPKGRPPEPPHVRGSDGVIDVRGPAELRWRLTPPSGARLDLRAEIGEDPAHLVVEVGDEEGWHHAGEARLSAPWIADRAVRETSFDLGRWGGRTIALRLRVLPEACGTPFTEARLVGLSVVGDD